MKLLKYGTFIIGMACLTSCVKSVNDVGGLVTDEGSIVTSVLETNYLQTESHIVGFGFSIFANFDFAQPAQEEVKFFTLHVSAPRSKKLNGPLKLKVTMGVYDGYELPPAGSITIPSEITIPPFDGPSIDFPVRFMVNKANLDPDYDYGVKFSVSEPNQGVVSRSAKSVEVRFINNRYTARYRVQYTVKDSANAIGIENNTKYVNLLGYSSTEIGYYDFYADGLGSANSYAIMAANRATGAATAVIYPTYILGTEGKVIDIINERTGVSYNPVFDQAVPNKYVYTANDNRSFHVKYTIRLTTNVNGQPLERPFTIEEKYSYDTPQAFY